MNGSNYRERLKERERTSEHLISTTRKVADFEGKVCWVQVCWMNEGS